MQKCRFIEMNDMGVRCWMEIDEGLQIVTILPKALFENLDLQQDDEFHWDINKRIASITQPEPASPELLQN